LAMIYEFLIYLKRLNNLKRGWFRSIAFDTVYSIDAENPRH